MKYKKEWPLRIKMRMSEKYGIHMDQSTIYRILKRRNIRYYNEYFKEKKNRKLYALPIPGMEIQMDTSFPFGYHRKFVIYGAIDDCTRIVYSKVYNSACLENTRKFIKEIVKRFPFWISKIRTDQGREFSKRITKYLKRFNIEHIQNEPYHPEHNGKIERYHKTENEEINTRNYLISFEEANYNLRQRNSYYNNCRRHTGLWMNNRTPYGKYLEFKQKMGT